MDQEIDNILEGEAELSEEEKDDNMVYYEKRYSELSTLAYKHWEEIEEIYYGILKPWYDKEFYINSVEPKGSCYLLKLLH